MSPEQANGPEKADFPEALTFNMFWQEFGADTGFTKNQLQEMWQDAQTYYSDLPYHNFFHVTETLVIASRLAGECEANGVAVDRRALTMATLFHDAGYHEDHLALGFKNKEEYSASIFRIKADEYGLTAAEAITANNAILSTQLGHNPETTEDKILVRSDLDNVVGDYEGFISKTNLLRSEAKLFDGYKGDVTFATTSLRVLAEYFSNDLSLGEWETNHWSLQATKNLQRLALEISKQQGVSAANYVKDLGSTAVNKLLLRHDSE